MRISEAVQQIVAIYPGRFHPFHKGHASVYDFLKNKYDNVYIATSDKVDPPKSPFSFVEKRQMMIHAGVPAAAIVQTKNPYKAEEILTKFDPSTTAVVFAVSAKDMAEDPRFAFNPKKDGSPSYFQPLEGQKTLAPYSEHGYITTVPTLDFSVLGKPMRSATELRQQFAAADEKVQAAIIRDLYGTYSPKIHKIMAAKILEGFERVTHIIEQIIELDRIKPLDESVKRRVASIMEAWSEKYKRSINCNNPRGFSQRAHCAGRKKNEGVNEAFDSPYPLVWEGNPNGDSSALAEIPTSNGNTAYLDIEFNTSGDSGRFDISFTRNSRSKASGTGDEFRVFATVIEAIKQWWNKVDQDRVVSITFSAAKNTNDSAMYRGAPDSPRRHILYSRFAKQFAKQIGFKLNIEDLGTGVYFFLTNPKSLSDNKLEEAFVKPQFDVEWEEAARYPEFQKIGKDAWIELAKKGKSVTIKSAKGINNTDAADPDSFKSLEPEKQKRALAQLEKGTVEMPIVAVYSDGYKELVGGNTRLTAMMARDGKATVWAFKVPDEVAKLAENFAEGKSPHKKGTKKYKAHMAAMHASMNESYKLQLERDDDLLVLHIKDTKTGKRTEVRGKPNYEGDGYDSDDKLHQLLDKIGKAANMSELMNGEVVTINPRHPQGPSAKAHADKAFNEDVAQDLEAEFPGLDLDLYNTQSGYILSKIVLPVGERNEGTGSKVMQRIVDMADQEGKLIALTPDTAFGGTKSRLIKFYKRFGFVPNKGRNKTFNFREIMVRYPKQTESISEAGVGRITPQNQTPDVGPNEIKKQAKKMGFNVDRDGRPPLLHKSAAKNSDPNTLFNLGLAESKELNENQVSISQDVDGGSLEGYVVDTNMPNLSNYLSSQGADPTLAEKISQQFGRIGVIRNMYVDDDRRGEGIGSELMSNAIDSAYDNDAEAIILVADTGESNEFDLVNWYNNYGFEKIGDASGDPIMLLAETKLQERGSISVPFASGTVASVYPHRPLKVKKGTPGKMRYEDIEGSADHSNGTYAAVYMKPQTAQRLVDWCRDNGIKTQPAEEMHCTLIYSKTPVPELSQFDGTPVNITASIRGWKLLGTALVLELDCAACESLNGKMMAAGATSDYPSYIAHTTIDPEYTGDMPTVMPDFDLEYNRVTVTPITPDRANPVAESRIMEKNVPTDPSKWSYYKGQAKKKFEVYPSAYANAWAAKKYKEAGGGWRKTKESLEELKCWTGYERVPGKRAGEPGSCRKRGTKSESMGEAVKDAGIPEAITDIDVNLKNRNKAFKEYQYGPSNPAPDLKDGQQDLGTFNVAEDLNAGMFKSQDEIMQGPNAKFWQGLMDTYNTEDLGGVLMQRCGNCAAFNVTKRITDAIADAIDPEYGDESATAGELGYCQFLKFKCAAMRTCEAWVGGGPITDETVEKTNEDLRDWFKQKWVNIGKKDASGKHPECGTSGSKKGYAKCVPASKAASMSKKEKESAVRRKRAAQNKAGRGGKDKPGSGKKPIRVSTKAKK